MRLEKLQALKEHRIATYTGHHADGKCVCAVVGFSTNSFVLNSRQNGLLAMSIATLKKPGSVLEMYARTDRSGAASYNMVLSRRRLIAVQNALMALGAPVEKVKGKHCKAMGEQFEEYYGLQDNTSYKGGRAVWAFFWPSPAAFEEGPDDGEAGFRKMTHFGRTFCLGG
jgi:hypothetical protein